MDLFIIPLALGPGQLVLIAIVVLILFGGGRKISELMLSLIHISEPTRPY